jgi:anti-anti-sigma regulatory factor
MTTQALVFGPTHDGVLVAPVHCSSLAVPDLQRYVRSWCDSEARPLVVDLSGVERFDHAALRALFWSRRYCRARSIPFAVNEPPEGALTALELAILRDLCGTPSGRGELVAQTPDGDDR